MYTNARELVLETYKLIDKFPQKEMYALSDQLRRAIVSVLSNIAEGLSRSSDKEKCHFLDIAYGSLMEAHCQLEIAADLKYITEEELRTLEKRMDEEATLYPERSLNPVTTRNTAVRRCCSARTALQQPLTLTVTVFSCASK